MFLDQCGSLTVLKNDSDSNKVKPILSDLSNEGGCSTATVNYNLEILLAYRLLHFRYSVALVLLK